MRRIILSTVLLLAAMAPATAQPAANKDIPGRVELHAIPSLWISDEQFLKGDAAGGKQVTLAGELRLARGGAGKQPVVILMHGSGGIGPNVPYWVRELNAIGISTFVIDGMSGRGLVGVGTNQAILGRLNFIVDIYRSLEILAKHPRIDPERIALMGFSRGGQAALYAAVDRFHKMWNKSGIGIAAYIPFYPDCATTYAADTEFVAKPVRIFHGTPDNYNPVSTCKAFLGRLKAANRDVTLTEYPNAPHGFDNPVGPVPAVPAKDNQSVRECTIKEAEPGNLVNEATKAKFTFQDACVKLNPLVGADHEAREAVHKEITAMLRGLFKLN